jgi:hypothetical protein
VYNGDNELREDTTMMMSEFIDRTGYQPNSEEYHYIEESYYEFDGNKDEFCKQWMKDNNDGHWAKELRLRKQMDEMKAQMQAIIDEKEENLKFYRPYPQKFWDADKQLKAANEKLERLERVFKRVYEIA